MKVYKVKTIVAGYKLGPEFRGKDYVATKVSETDYLGRTTEREKSFEIELMGSGLYIAVVDWKKESVFYNTFKDKFNRKIIDYKLGYFEWKPEKRGKQESLF